MSLQPDIVYMYSKNKDAKHFTTKERKTKNRKNIA